MLSTLLLPGKALAQWQEVATPPLTFGIQSLFDGGNEIYANSEWGLHRSYSQGVNWEENLLQHGTVFQKDGDTLYCNLYDEPMGDYAISYDNGYNWTFFQTGLGYGRDQAVIGKWLFVIKFDVNLCYLYRVNLENGTKEIIEWDLSAFPSAKLERKGNELWVTDYSRLKRTIDAGDTWEEITPESPPKVIKEFLILGDTFLVLNSQNIVVRSMDNGANWQTLGTFPESLIGSSNKWRYVGGRLFALGDKAILVSDDIGETWTVFFTPIKGLLLDVLQLGDDYLVSNISGRSPGFHRSMDNGITWSHITGGFQGISRIDTVFAANDDIIISNGYNRFSEDGGMTWNIFSLDSVDAILGLVKKNGQYYCHFQDKLYASYGDFTYWQLVNPSFQGTCCLSVAEDLLLAIDKSGYQYVIYSTDNGYTWEESGGKVPQYTGTVYRYANVGKMMFNVPPFTIAHISPDLGISWDNYPWQGWFGVEGRVKKITANNDNLFQLADRDFCIFKKGGGWSYKTQQLINQTGITNPYFKDIEVSTEGVLITDTLDRVFFSPDFGDLWTLLNDSISLLPDEHIRFLKSNEQAFYLITNQDRVWRLDYTSLENLYVRGQVFNDLNDNGSPDSGEPPLPGVIVWSSQHNAYTSTDSLGRYTFFAQSFVNDTIKVFPPSSYGVANPPLYVANSAASDQHFAVHFTPAIYDLAISATPFTPFRPGFMSYIYLSCKNWGTEATDGQIKFVPSVYFDSLSADPPTSSVIGDTLVWDVADLMMLEKTSILISAQMAMDAPLGDTVVCYARASHNHIEQTPDDNIYRLESIIVGSFDPNDKRVEPVMLTPEELVQDNRLTYTVRFQNTGTYPATYVTITDALSPLLDLSTLQVLDASHPMTWALEGNRTLKFYFNNINLPDSTTNEPGSHGYVRFSLQARQNLQPGTNLSNRASIYFDFNLPIHTNYATTNVIAPSLAGEASLPGHLLLMPNPATRQVQIDLPAPNHSPGTVEVYTTAGVKKLTQSTGSHSTLLDLKGLAPGLYLVVWVIQGRRFVGKLVVQA